jgi:predicted DNA-binding transcriptional regulator YafY
MLLLIFPKKGPMVRKENPMEEVVLIFSAKRSPYLLTKPLHSSQTFKSKFKDGSVSFSLKLRFNNELLALILGFGADVQVIKPAFFREQVKNAAKKMVDIY